MFNLFRKNKNENEPNETKNSRFTFFKVGFHGDEYLLKVVDVLAMKSEFFIETGSNVGSTLGYFARKFPKVKCLSCEPDLEAYHHAVKNSVIENVDLFNESSQEFIQRLKKDYQQLQDRPTLFWLDAHGYGFQWPLIEEMVFILNEYKTFFILIDDFKVPGIPEFGYDIYENQFCSHEYLEIHLPSKEYYLYYPSYLEKTSKHHPLRGWGLYSSEKIDWKKYGIDFVTEEFHERK